MVYIKQKTNVTVPTMEKVQWLQLRLNAFWSCIICADLSKCQLEVTSVAMMLQAQTEREGEIDRLLTVTAGSTSTSSIRKLYKTCKTIFERPTRQINNKNVSDHRLQVPHCLPAYFESPFVASDDVVESCPIFCLYFPFHLSNLTYLMTKPYLEEQD